MHHEQSEAENHALEFLNEVIHKLMNDPGLYETYQKELTTLYLEFVDNHHVISNAIESIFVSVRLPQRYSNKLKHGINLIIFIHPISRLTNKISATPAPDCVVCWTASIRHQKANSVICFAANCSTTI